MMKKTGGKTAVVFLLTLILTFSVWSSCFAEDPSELNFRRDSMSRTGSEFPGNMRFLIGEEGNPAGNYTYSDRSSSRYGLPSKEDVNKKGVDQLYISGSAEYSADQFANMVDRINELTNQVLGHTLPIYIIDLRQETHGFVYGTNEDTSEAISGIPFSAQAEHNWVNIGMSTKEVIAKEKSILAGMAGKEITYSSGRPGRPGSSGTTPTTTTISVSRFITEEQMVKETDENIGYLRLAIPDRTCPEPEIIDMFIHFVKGIDMNNSWLHFHCLAGIGRTGIMMSVYDMMKNPDVPMTDILTRQTMTGSGYPMSPASSQEYLAAYDAERLRLIPLIYQYIQENWKANYPISFSEWLVKKDEPEPTEAPASPTPAPTPRPAVIPKTGDTFDLEAAAGIAAIGLAGMLAVSIRRLRK